VIELGKDGRAGGLPEQQVHAHSAALVMAGQSATVKVLFACQFINIGNTQKKNAVGML